MPTPASFTDVIDLWDSPTAAIADIGCSSSQLFKWRRRDRIPQEWWAAVLACEVAKRHSLTAELFVEFAARDLVEARP